MKTDEVDMTTAVLSLLLVLPCGCSNASGKLTIDGAKPYDLAVTDHRATPDLASRSDSSVGDGGALVVFGCGGAPVGTIGAVFWGIPAYCQQQFSSVGFYQCDELANRFVRDALRHPNLDNVVTDNASTICGKASGMIEYSVWGPSFRSTTGNAPVPGDLIVFKGTPGHVAVITGASSSTVSYFQQNMGPPTGSVGWDPATSFFVNGSLSPACWVHAEPSAPAPPPGGPDCGCYDGPGSYCGLSIVDHEHWYACTANVVGGAPSYDTLYECAAGVFTVKSPCTRCVTPQLKPATGNCG